MSSLSNQSISPPTSHTSEPWPAQATETTSTSSTLVVLLLFSLPLITADLSQLSGPLRMPFIKPLAILVAILMALFLAHLYTTFDKFRHPAGVLLQFLNYNIIIIYSSIDLYLSTISPFIHAIWPGLGNASSSLIGCAIIILMVTIAQGLFWALVVCRHSEERLGLQGGVQRQLYRIRDRIREWLFFLSARLYAVVRDTCQLISQFFALERPQSTDTDMTPPPLYSLYNDTDPMYRLSNVDKV